MEDGADFLDTFCNSESRSKVDVDRATLGCAILIKFCDLLHAGMFYSNSESLDTSQAVPDRSGKDCSLLLSVTDPKLPTQPGSSGLRYWFPPERQLKQPQADSEIHGFLTSAQESASSRCPPKAADLLALVADASDEDLKNKCTQLGIQVGRLNRLQMAEKILEADVNTEPQPGLNGKVLSAMV